MMGMKGVKLGLLGLMVLTSVINAQRRPQQMLATSAEVDEDRWKLFEEFMRNALRNEQPSPPVLSPQQMLVTSAEVDEDRWRLFEEFMRKALRNEQPPPPVLSKGEGEEERKRNMEKEGNNKSEGKRQEEGEQESQAVKDSKRRSEWKTKKEIKRAQSLRAKAQKRDSKRKRKAGSQLRISSAKEVFLTKVSDFYLTKIRKSFEEGKSFDIVDSRDLSDMKSVIFSGVEALKRAGRVKVTAGKEVTSPIHILGVEAHLMRSQYSREGDDVADLPTVPIDVTGRMVLRVEDNGQGEWHIELKDFFVDDVRGSKGVLYGSDVSLEMLAESFRSASFGSVVKELMKKPVRIHKHYLKKSRSLGLEGLEGGEEREFDVVELMEK